MRGVWKRLLGEREPAHLAAGRWGEEQAERHLRDKGYEVVGRRIRVGARDELDVVARQGNVLVFVEVKTRKDEDFGRPFTAVNRAKRACLSRAAVHYLTRLEPGRRPAYFRFDVVEVVGEPGGPPRAVRHIENAFALEGGYRLPW